MLVTDLALHGRRFVTVEFMAAAVVCGALAILLLILAIARSATAARLIGVVFFLGISINSFAVVRFARAPRSIQKQASWLDVLLFGLLTLAPLALALALSSVDGRDDLTGSFDERANDGS